MKTPTILITGASGQLGQCLAKLENIQDRYQLILTDFPELDITDPKAVDGFIRLNKPDFIINCAAYTAVDQAETETEKALSINAYGPENLARAAKTGNSTFIHISTDYVFSGQNWKPYSENDPTGPASAYGRTKLEGEKALLRIGGKQIILRTSWLYSEFGKNFFLTMMRLGREKSSIGVVADQIGSPTYAGDLAEGLLRVVGYCEDHPAWPGDSEIFHFSNTGVASWFDLSRTIMDLAGSDCQVVPLTTEEYPLPAPRPAYSVMNTRKFRERFQMEIPYWKNGLITCYKRYLDLRKP